jgi:endonuclease-3
MRRQNRAALAKIGSILARMRAAAKEGDAAVYRAERSTRETPFKMLAFTMLSARTKDETTMKVVARLFAVADTPGKVLALGRGRLEKLLYGVGFYHVKAKSLLGACRMLERNGGMVPDTLEGLLALPGVGRKTANIVLARAFGKASLGVDVHVHRISNRLGIVSTKKPGETETALLRLVPRRYIRTLNRDFVAFGQTVCLPRRPLCDGCPVRKFCWRIGVK